VNLRSFILRLAPTTHNLRGYVHRQDEMSCTAFPLSVFCGLLHVLVLRSVGKDIPFHVVHPCSYYRLHGDGNQWWFTDEVNELGRLVAQFLGASIGKAPG
jgi:hypothetical protein